MNVCSNFLAKLYVKLFHYNNQHSVVNIMIPVYEGCSINK